MRGDRIRCRRKMSTGIVFDIRRYAIHDGPGIRTTVFLKGCPLACAWCHNPEGLSGEITGLYRKDRCVGCGECVSSCTAHALDLTPEGVVTDPSLCGHCGFCGTVCPAEARDLVGKSMDVARVMEVVRKDVLFFDESGGGVTFSGGEPLMQPEFLLSLLEACGDLAIHRAVDTTGLAPVELMAEAADRTDLFLYDLKHMDPEKHRAFTGVSNERILDNLRLLSSRGADIRIRIPLIPGINSDPENLDRTGSFIAALPAPHPVDLLPYHDWARNKYSKFNIPFRLDGVSPPSESEVEAAAERLRGFGLNVGIGG